jgi:hypothetical protein
MAIVTHATNGGKNTKDNRTPKASVTGAKANFLLSLARIHNLVIELKTGNLIPLSLAHSEAIYTIVIATNNFNVSR